MSRGGIDYSKWDKILDDYSSGSDDDNDETLRDAGGSSTTAGPARVTRLDGPSRVTFGGKDGTGKRPSNVLQVEPSPPSSLPSSSAAPGTSSSSTTSPELTTKEINSKKSKIEQQEKQWTEHGGMIMVPYPTPFLPTLETGEKDSTKQCKLYWCQTRHSVTFRLELVDTPTHAIQGKDIHVDVTGILPFRERHMAVGTAKPKLHVTANLPNACQKDIGTTNTSSSATSNKIAVPLLDCTLPHPVYMAQDDEEELNGTIDWVIERQEQLQMQQQQRYIAITLFKAVPMDGMSIWWDEPILGSKSSSSTSTTSDGGRPVSSPGQQNASFVQAWEEAHRLFREKRQQEKDSVENDN